MAVLKFVQVSFIGQKSFRSVSSPRCWRLGRPRVDPHRWLDPASSSRSDSAVTGKCHWQFSRGRVVDPQTNAILPANNIRAFAYFAGTKVSKSRWVRWAVC